MTTILIARTRVYTDTVHYKDGERFHSLTKINALKVPLVLTWVPRPGVALDQDRFPAEFTDTIHGYAVTGANPPGEEMMKRLVTAGGEMDPVFEFYYNVAKSKLITGHNHFTVIMFGQEADYSFSQDFTEVTLSVLERDDPTGYGSGGHFALRELLLRNDPIRALYHAFWQDDTSGGIVDCWSLPTADHPVLERVGICNARTKIELLHELEKPFDQKLMMDFVSQKFCDEVAHASAAMGESMGGKILKEKQRKAATKKAPTKPSRKSTTTRTRK